MTARSKKIHKVLLTVLVEASSKKTAEDMVESLARAACDVANSTTDDKAHISVREAP